MGKMLSVITRNIMKKPATINFPEYERTPFERLRGRIVFNPENCIYCGICQRKCPADAIEVNRGEGTWKLNAFRCVICGECAATCPKKCIDMTNERRHSSFEKETIEVKKSI